MATKIPKIKIEIVILFSFVNLAETMTKKILNTATKARRPLLELRMTNLVGEIGDYIKTAILRGTRVPEEPKPC